MAGCQAGHRRCVVISATYVVKLNRRLPAPSQSAELLASRLRHPVLEWRVFVRHSCIDEMSLQKAVYGEHRIRQCSPLQKYPPRRLTREKNCFVFNLAEDLR
jgi:hypothetical protein